MARQDLQQSSAIFAVIWLVLIVVLFMPQGGRAIQRITHPLVSRIFPTQYVSVNTVPGDSDQLAIIRFTQEPYRRRVVINRGADNGVKAGSVLASKGVLVGIVQETSAHTSVVQLVSDPDFRVVGTIRNTDVIVTGQGAVVRAERIPANATIETGDQLTTSVLDGKVPRGLVIGTVRAITSEGQLLKAAHVVPVIDPEQPIAGMEIIDE